MTQLFAVMRTRGPAWNESVPMEQQVDWRAHAEFMNALHAEGVALLAGSLGGTRDVLLSSGPAARPRSRRGWPRIAGV